MGRSKDRARIDAMRRLNPDYRGFRGYELEPNRVGNTPLVSVSCSNCGRKRNVPVGLASEQGDYYVCRSCQDAETIDQVDGDTQ